MNLFKHNPTISVMKTPECGTHYVISIRTHNSQRTEHKYINLGLLASAVYIIPTWLPTRVCFLDVLEMSLEKYWEICGLRFLKEHLSPWLAAKWHGHRGRPSYRIMKRYRGQTRPNKTRCLFYMSSCLLIVSSCLPVALSFLFRGYPKISNGPWTGLWILGKKLLWNHPPPATF